MKVIKNNRYLQSISICIFLFIILFACYKLGKVSSDTAVAIGVAIIGLIGITFQVIINRDISSAGYDLELQNTFTQDENMTNLFLYCWSKFDKKPFAINGRKISKLTNIPNIDSILISYFTFFESVYLMYKRNVIKIELLDDLFGRRFFSVVNNKEVQDYELLKNWQYYKNIYYLYKDWSKFKKNQDYPLMKNNDLISKIFNYSKNKKNDKSLEEFAKNVIKINNRKKN